MDRSAATRDFPDDRLRFLYESVRLGTMRAASDYLNMAPSSISRQITGLEKDLGTDLVEKNRHRILLTPAGERLIEYYRDRLAQRESLQTDLDDLKGLRQGHVRIAVGKGLIRVALASVVSEYTVTYPGIKVAALDVSSRAVIPMIRDDEVHFGVVMDPPPDPRVWSRAVFPQPFCLIAAPSHALARRTTIDVKELVNHPLILPEEGFRVRELLADAEVSHRIFLDTRITTTSIQFIADVVMSGSLATVIPADCVTDYIQAKSLVAVPLSNPGLNSAKVHLVTRVGRRLPGGALNLLELLERFLKSRERRAQLGR